MNFFNKILEKIGIRKETPASEEAAPAAPTAAKAAPAKPSAPSMASAARAMKDDRDMKDAPVKKAISEVDVVANLEKMAAANPAQLNWRVSIVDLLKLLDLDSSGTARKELAEELGCPADMMSDSARMNTWLHKTVLRKIAENGGNIPQDLLD